MSNCEYIPNVFVTTKLSLNHLERLISCALPPSLMTCLKDSKLFFGYIFYLFQYHQRAPSSIIMLQTQPSYQNITPYICVTIHNKFLSSSI